MARDGPDNVTEYDIALHENRRGHYFKNIKRDFKLATLSFAEAIYWAREWDSEHPGDGFSEEWYRKATENRDYAFCKWIDAEKESANKAMREIEAGISPPGTIVPVFHRLDFLAIVEDGKNGLDGLEVPAEIYELAEEAMKMISLYGLELY